MRTLQVTCKLATRYGGHLKTSIIIQSSAAKSLRSTHRSAQFQKRFCPRALCKESVRHLAISKHRQAEHMAWSALVAQQSNASRHTVTPVSSGPQWLQATRRYAYHKRPHTCLQAMRMMMHPRDNMPALVPRAPLTKQ